MMNLETINEKMRNIEREYNEKLIEAAQNENYDKITGLFYELKFFRNYYNKKIRYIKKRDEKKY